MRLQPVGFSLSSFASHYYILGLEDYLPPMKLKVSSDWGALLGFHGFHCQEVTVGPLTPPTFFIMEEEHTPCCTHGQVGETGNRKRSLGKRQTEEF